MKKKRVNMKRWELRFTLDTGAVIFEVVDLADAGEAHDGASTLTYVCPTVLSNLMKMRVKDIWPTILVDWPAFTSYG